jgi:predicted RNase H-like HicB family nuclease
MLYPVSVHKPLHEEMFTVAVVDIPGCQVKAKSIDLALVQIEEVMAEHLSLLAEYGEAIPQAKPIEQHMKLTSDPTIVWAVINFDITPYLGKSHKINVTLPELLIKKIDDCVARKPEYKTRSGFIATACIAELARK